MRVSYLCLLTAKCAQAFHLLSGWDEGIGPEVIFQCHAFARGFHWAPASNGDGWCEEAMNEAGEGLCPVRTYTPPYVGMRVCYYINYLQNDLVYYRLRNVMAKKNWSKKGEGMVWGGLLWEGEGKPLKVWGPRASQDLMAQWQLRVGSPLYPLLWTSI